MQAAVQIVSVRVFAMSNYILKYKRDDEVKYISHLDFVRFIQRVMRRADLPMAFSTGFNPHPIMSVAMPLSVGVTADGELMKIGLDGDFLEKEVMDTLNNAFPKGFEIVKAQKTEGKEFDFNKINRAEYICECEIDDKCSIDIEKFLSNDSILIMKKSKSGIKEADIKSHIHSLEVISKDENSITFKMCTDAGNNYNLKPDSVIEAMEKYDENFKTSFYTVRRCKLLCGDKELF